MNDSPLKLLTDAWPIVLSLVSLVAWSIRLEGRTTDSARRVADLERNHNELRSKLDTELVAIRERLVRIEVLLTAATNDIHKDVRR